MSVQSSMTGELHFANAAADRHSFVGVKVHMGLTTFYIIKLFTTNVTLELEFPTPIFHSIGHRFVIVDFTTFLTRTFNIFSMKIKVFKKHSHIPEL